MRDLSELRFNGGGGGGNGGACAGVQEADEDDDEDVELLDEGEIESVTSRRGGGAGGGALNPLLVVVENGLAPVDGFTAALPPYTFFCAVKLFDSFVLFPTDEFVVVGVVTILTTLPGPY